MRYHADRRAKTRSADQGLILRAKPFGVRPFMRENVAALCRTLSSRRAVHPATNSDAGGSSTEAGSGYVSQTILKGPFAHPQTCHYCFGAKRYRRAIFERDAATASFAVWGRCVAPELRVVRLVTIGPETFEIIDSQSSSASQGISKTT